MTELPAARTTKRRMDDALRRLEEDVDAWVATAGADGTPCMVPLSFLWDGEFLWFSTRDGNPTAVNARAGGVLRIALGPTRDVVLIEGAVEQVALADVSAARADAFAAKAGFDPRAAASGSYVFLRVRPRWVQAWREVNELAGRDLMRDGEWLT